jgi:predicted TIM-barrel fold metal-dependent hydrolase
MLSRRDFLVGAGVAGVITVAGRVTRAFAVASQPSTPVNFDVPEGSCDCHTHILDPRRFPYVASRVSTPESASVDEIRSLHRALHIDRVVIVQPSFYGPDDSCTLDAIHQLGSSARGIAVIDDRTSQSDLDQMHRRGIRGVRLNLETSGQVDPSVAKQRFKAMAELMKGRNSWHIEMYTRLSVIEAIKDEVTASPVPVSFDHFGGAQAALGLHQPGFDVLLSLVNSGKAYVKVSAAYRSSNLAPDYSDVAPLAKALIAANPRRIVWGSDWPHPQRIAGRKPEETTPFYQIDDGRVLNQLALWAPSPEERKLILVENPATLYGF